MVDIQDSKDEDEKMESETIEVDREPEKETDSDDESLADKYIKRRGLDTSTPFTSEIEEIGYIENTDRVGVKIKTPDFDFVVDLGQHRDSIDSDLLEFLSDCPRKIMGRNGISLNNEFDSWFSSDLRRFGFKDDSKRFHISIEDKPNLEGDASDIIADIAPYYEYEKQSGDKPGIRKVMYSSDESEKLKLSTEIEQKEIQWVFQIPFQVDIEDHPLAGFIEEVGNGDPRNLNGSEAYVVHESDVTSNLNPIGYDTSMEWALVQPSNYESWDPHTYTNHISQNHRRKDALLFALMYITYILFATLFLIGASQITSFII